MGHIYKILQLIVDYHKLDLDESEDSRPSNEMIRHKVRSFMQASCFTRFLADKRTCE